MDKKMMKVQSGHAVFGDKGEFHETTTETGLMAIVIESENLESNIGMPIAEIEGEDDRRIKR